MTSTSEDKRLLRGSISQYMKPFESVGETDWDALKDKELLTFLINAAPEKYTLTDKQYQSLLNILDRAPDANERLRELLVKKAPWE